MKRTAFLAASAAAAVSGFARAQEPEEYDPAQSSSTAALRVLLGPGSAVANRDGTFSFNGHPYRGSFTALSDGTIVNTVGLEAYLYSVVTREMSPSWPAGALEAQAICARTYVLQRSNPRRAYDLVPSELDQVYGGIATESPAGRTAVDATNAQVLRFNDAFAQIMYSSCCGGHTEASSDAWGGAPIAYLGGVVCTSCTASPNYRWQRTIALADIASRFPQELAAFGNLTQIRVSEVDESGRARMVELVAEHGSAFVKGSAFRIRVGARVVPSLLITKIEPSMEAPAAMIIEGGGLGHGVGLCQWGARGMALAGGTASTILNFYFPGTMIGND